MNQQHVRAEVLVSGRVQGVFFRATTRSKADELGVTGWVRNRPDGKVEAVCEGSQDAVRKLVSWFHTGPRGARVESVDINWTDATDEFSGFRVRH